MRLVLTGAAGGEGISVLMKVTAMKKRQDSETRHEVATSETDCGSEKEDGGDARGIEGLVSDLGRPDATALDVYFAKLRHLAPLSADQQVRLARKYHRDGDQRAAEILLSTNLRLVVKIAREYCRRPDELLELIQEGNLGLAEALERYEPERGVKFTTYAQHWVRAMIMGYLINQKYPVRLGSSRAGRTIFYNLNKARKRLRADGEEPTPSALADELDVEESDIVRVAAQMEGGAVSLDTPVEADGGTSLSDVMVADCQTPEEELLAEQENRLLRESIEAFGEELEDERDRCIWFDRTIADEPQTLRELGERFDVSKERIRQVEVKLQEEFTDRLRRELPELLI